MAHPSGADVDVLPSRPETRTNQSRDRRKWLEIERECINGLRNHWYAVIPSDEIPADRPLGIKRLGEELVVWRGADGRAHVMPDRCPHRGARLSVGKVEGSMLRCWYHGWLYDGSGQCVSIPSEGGECKLTNDVQVKSYPTEEHGGVIFTYFSSDGRAPDRSCDNPFELENSEWNGFIVRHHWAGVNWFRAMDNLIDPLHGPFLHAGTYTLSRSMGDRDMIEVVPKADGSYHVGRKGQALVNFDYTEYHFPNWFRLDIPYPWSAGPGGPMRILVFVCPIDETSTQVYMVRKRKITGWKWWLWKLLWRVRLERKMWEVIDQDVAILTSQRGSAAPENEYLVQGDTGIVHLRNLFREAVAKERAVS
jgi:phenylpropionate dioxygenase-like ring-hydroxylating dioxygenase large terminal subunit